ncbi:MAG: betaine/proline/choline family ABC transporter ATP-binding protein [Thermacetogeniaceae bacterium]|nr:betaine/proline/choline family ABC transporter ATP-binding protein [Syntrophomonadaceae bacterium]
MIELHDVTKIYAGQTVPAVKNLTLKIKEGETCVFVGPSGCGKSTILRMINRMIEQTSGTILINNKDIREADPDRLRMGIGYVIQQIGLLPHRTIAENISIVPRLYGWDKERIRKRVDELLELMGLDPDETRDKFPAQLSGGQMQRVGVARAMAADPPIMLMDEPFGAVDPIVRGHLQDEFLKIQREMKKTICFVTHDINEAIKMGDTIAIFEKGQLVQHGTPQEILSKPKNEFVRTFIGTDRVVKMLTLFQVRSITKDNYSIIRENELANIRQKMDDEGAAVGILMNESAKPCGLITRDDLEKAGELNPEKIKEIACGKKDAFIDGDLLLNDALSLMLEWNCDYLGVLDGAQLIGIVSFDDIRECVRRKEGE